ncbi:MAG: transposase, partial [Anaerolineae bacterium]|nr:transposase [Anaerolineae bacterium]
IQNGECLLGDVTNNQLVLSPAGHMVTDYWQRLEIQYPCFILDDFVVMPNHFHAIVLIDDLHPEKISLSRGVQWFKITTTNAYIKGVNKSAWTPFSGKLWHRSFYDRIIRNEHELFAIKTYISQNPERWIEDKFHPSKPSID